MRLEEQKLSTCWAGESLSVMLQKKKDVFIFYSTDIMNSNIL